MKLYSRGQLIFVGIAAAAVALLLIVGLGVIKLPFVAPDRIDEQNPIADLGDNESLTFELETSTPLLESDNFIPVVDTDNYTQSEVENITIYEKYSDAVVNITTEVMAYNWFLEPVPQEGGSGSGSIIDRRGYILTNYHVVEDAYKVFIILSDNEEYQGEVIGTDPQNDLAVIKFNPGDKELTTIPFGTSDGLRVGQKVLAIGNPFGLDKTLTTGIVSALERPLKTSEGFIIRKMIQTDASINPGNSGGPLLNSRGEMIGINTMIYTPSGGSVGIGFAIPVNTAKRIIPDLIQYGKVRRGWIDIVPIQLFPQLVRYAKLPISRGLLVSKVTEGGNAEKSGIRGGDRDTVVRSGRTYIYLGGDIIVEVDDEPVSTISDLFNALEDNKPGDKVDVTVLRGAERKKISITLSEQPERFKW